MGIEIERKFLVKRDQWRSLGEGVLYRQGYLSLEKERVVRIRIINHQGYITIKSTSKGASRAEFEYSIPYHDAEYMLKHLCERPLIEKKRYRIKNGELTWEIDEFLNENQGLILAEVELQSEDQDIEFPAWIGQEVTGDPKYYNSNLVRKPFKKWKNG
jgi:adenylate cyclase